MFCRVHRSSIVNLNRVRGLKLSEDGEYDVLLESGARLRLSRRYRKELQARMRLSTLYVTHDQEEAMAMSDRIVVMREGLIEQQGKPLDIYENPRTRFVADFLGVCKNSRRSMAYWLPSNSRVPCVRPPYSTAAAPGFWLSSRSA